MGGGVKLTAVQGWDHWRVKMAWPDHAPRLFGKFASKAEAEKWITEHHGLTEQSNPAPDAPEAHKRRCSSTDHGGGKWRALKRWISVPLLAVQVLRDLAF
jgi:hypothetical protein